MLLEISRSRKNRRNTNEPLLTEIDENTYLIATIYSHIFPLSTICKEEQGINNAIILRRY